MDPRLDAIALLYLSFAHGTDGVLSGEEMRLLASKLGGWQPQSSLDAVGGHLKSTVDRYKRLGSQDARLAEARKCVATLRRSLDSAARERIVGDLRELAAVDGEITPEEAALLDEVALAMAPAPQ